MVIQLSGYQYGELIWEVGGMSSIKNPELAATSQPGEATLDRSSVNTTTKPKSVPLDEIVIDGPDWPLIPDGEYAVAYIHHETALVFNTPKIFIHFKIIDIGPYQGIRLYRAYRARELIGRPGKNGRFKLSRRSELYIALCWLYQARKMRPDRITLRDLKQLILKVSVRTVKKDYKQRLLPDSLHYSVVSEIKGIEVGAV